MRIIRKECLLLLVLFCLTSCMINTEGINARSAASNHSVATNISKLAELGMSSTVEITEISNSFKEAYIIWSDSHKEQVFEIGSFSYVYPEPGIHEIKVEFIGFDGEVKTQILGQTEVSLFVGDAPQFFNFSEPFAWRDAWTSAGLSITHKSNYTDEDEVWSEVSFSGWDSSSLDGLDISMGQLGVSGSTSTTGTFYQLIDGTEALRFILNTPAHAIEIEVVDLMADEFSVHDEAMRIQFFDASDVLVTEQIVSGDDDGIVLVSLQSETSFTSIVITSGGYDGASFVYGAYVDDSQQVVSSPVDEGSEMLIDSLRVRYTMPE